MCLNDSGREPSPLKSVPQIRLVPPGRLLHLGRHCGARRAWWIRRSHPAGGLVCRSRLMEIVLGPSLPLTHIQDRTCMCRCLCICCKCLLGRQDAGTLLGMAMVKCQLYFHGFSKQASAACVAEHGRAQIINQQPANQENIVRSKQASRHANQPKKESAQAD